MKPKTFTQHTDIPRLDGRKKRTWRLKAFAVLGSFIFIFLMLFSYLLYEYIETHTFKFQSPVLVQKPVIIKRVEIVSPLASRSASLGVAYAEEYTNPYDTRSPKGIAWQLVYDKWGIQEWGFFDELVMRESGWNPYSVNSSSGACYLAQALPCSKMNAEPWDYEAQLKWMVNYVSQRYQNPSNALKFHDQKNWY